VITIYVAELKKMPETVISDFMGTKAVHRKGAGNFWNSFDFWDVGFGTVVVHDRDSD
jgi:hypothetical protein